MKQIQFYPFWKSKIMKYIKKGNVPSKLIEINKDKSKTYDNDVCDNNKTNPIITVKTDTLKALIKDQGSICCYCMQKISTDNLTSASSLYPTIEHYIAQTTQESKDNNLDTNYKNMLATCHGNDKKDPENKHCDSSRGSKPFKFLNPLEKSCERVLGYAYDGSIICRDETLKNDIENDIKLLNLNFQKLKENRESIIKAIKTTVKFRRNKLKTKWNKEQFKKEELEKCKMSSNGTFEPFVQVKIYELEKL